MIDQTELPFTTEDSYSRASALILVMLLKWWNLNKVIPIVLVKRGVSYIHFKKTWCCHLKKETQ